MKTKKLALVFLAIFIGIAVFGLVSQLLAATQSWPFTTAGEYTLSDDTKIEISAGQAWLKANWQSSSWKYRAIITIDHTKVISNLTNFPVLITEVNLPANFWTKVKSDGSDIWLEDSEATKLKRELVSIDIYNQTIELWAKIPSLSSTTDTVIYLYYGNENGTETNDADTWDTNFKTVQHLGFDAGTGIPKGIDSTANDLDLSVSATAGQGLFQRWTSVGNTSSVGGWQALAFDGTYYYVVHSATNSNWLKKYTRDADTNEFTEVASNTNIKTESGLTSPPSGYWTHFGDGNIYDGKIYLPVEYWNNTTLANQNHQISVWNCDDLSWVSNNSLGGSPSFATGGFHFDGTTFYFVAYHPSGENTIYVYNADYSHGTDITLSAAVRCMEGITSDGTYFYISNHCNESYIRQVSLTGTILKIYASPVITSNRLGAVEYIAPTLTAPYGEIAVGSETTGMIYFLRPPVDSGKIGSGIEFYASQDYLYKDQVTTFGGITALTIEGWVYLKTIPAVDNRFVNYFTNYVPYNALSLRLNGTGGVYQLGFRFGTENKYGDFISNPANAWHHYAVRYNGTTGYLYLDGVGVGWADTTGTIETGGTLSINPVSSSNIMKGIYDEVHISSIDRGEAYLQTSYNNQNSPSTFYNSSEQTIYSSSDPTIQPTVANSLTFTSLSSFTETATKNNGEIKYQISNDTGTTWYWYNSGWTATIADYSESNTASDINSNISTFPAGDGEFLFKAFLHSNGTQLVQLDNITVGYSANTAPFATFDNDFSTWETGNVTVNYNSIDSENNTCNISQTASSGIEYSTDNLIWHDATDGGGASEGLTGLAGSASPGANHVFVWDSTTDLPTTEDSTVYLRIRPNDGTADADFWVTSNVFGIDNVAPSPISAPSFGTITPSSIVINKPGTVTENGSGLYQWQARRNSTTELGFTDVGTTSIADSSLSANTQYAYDVQFKDNASNVSSYGTQVAAYTLAPAPTNLAVTAGTNQTTLSVDSLNNATSGSSGYYFSRNDGTNSGWLTTNTWTDTSYFGCGIFYTYSAKYRNGDGTETATLSSTNSVAPKTCGGGNLPSFYSNPPTPASIPTSTPTITLTPTSTIPTSIIERLPEILQPLIPEFLKPKPQKEVKPPEIPVEELVSKQAPLAFQAKWQLLPPKPIREFVLSPLPKEIRNLAEKFPELEKTLKKVGIIKITDVAKLKTTQLTLSGLTKKLVPIPTDIVFAKTGGKLIDFNIALSITEKGEPQQKITTISDKPLQLTIRPDQSVKSVKGYIIFKSKKPQESPSSLPFNQLTASLIFANPVFAKVQEQPVRVEEKLVLQEFEYTDPDGDGVYTAEIQAPIVEGEYEIITVMDYENPKLGDKETRLVTVVDPEGYIYEKEGDKETRIPGAIASLFWLNPETKQYELWPAKEYQQENPQTTDVRGTYSFLVPEGFYYLKVETPGYLIYDGKPFQVTEGSGIHVNIEVKTKYWWLKIFDWKIIIMIIFGILLLYNFYRDKIREKPLKSKKI